MDRRRLVILGLTLALASVTWAASPGEEEGSDDAVTEALVLDLGGGDPGDSEDVQPSVDCSDGRPDRDCLSGRLGADRTTQQCGGISIFFGVSSCSVHCGNGYYACGKCGWGGFAMCTCRENFSCHPNRP